MIYFLKSLIVKYYVKLLYSDSRSNKKRKGK